MFVAGKFINIFSVRTVLAFCGIMPPHTNQPALRHAGICFKHQ
jgi:hypothetical protein